MQHSVLKRPGNENTRIPHLLYVDEFPDFLCEATLGLISLYRKYKVGTIITIQSLSQLDVTPTSRKVILSNCTSKMVFGNMTPEENKFWQEEFGYHREWMYSQDMKIKPEGKGGQMILGESSAESVSYGDYKGIKWGWKETFSYGKIQGLKFKNCGFKYKDDKGKNFSGVAILDFLPSKYKEPHKEKSFNFAKYQTGIVNEEKEKRHKDKFNPGEVDFDSFGDDVEVDPIQTDNTDIRFTMDNDDAIIYDIKKAKKNNN